MMFAHLTIAGFAEFAVTFGIFAYLQRANLPILRINHANVPETELDVPPPGQAGLALGADRPGA